jgi:hypothetical protein
MKRCPSCGKTYSDQNINFCLNDGELLSRLTEPNFSSSSNDEPPPTIFADDSPPTLMMNSARITNQTNWQAPAQPPVPWQPQQPVGFASGLPAHLQPKSQTLPTVALILGISSLIFVCCFGGIWLGLPAAITGFIGMRNADMFPDRFSGRGMAITAMIIGTVTFFISIVQVILTAIGD